MCIESADKLTYCTVEFLRHLFGANYMYHATSINNCGPVSPDEQWVPWRKSSSHKSIDMHRTCIYCTGTDRKRCRDRRVSPWWDAASRRHTRCRSRGGSAMDATPARRHIGSRGALGPGAAVPRRCLSCVSTLRSQRSATNKGPLCGQLSSYPW